MLRGIGWLCGIQCPYDFPPRGAFMQNVAWPARTTRGGLSLLLAGIWWVLDRLYGDQVFAVIKPMIPTPLQAWEAALALAFSYGHPSF